MWLVFSANHSTGFTVPTNGEEIFSVGLSRDWCKTCSVLSGERAVMVMLSWLQVVAMVTRVVAMVTRAATNTMPCILWEAQTNTNAVTCNFTTTGFHNNQYQATATPGKGYCVTMGTGTSSNPGTSSKMILCGDGRARSDREAAVSYSAEEGWAGRSGWDFRGSSIRNS